MSPTFLTLALLVCIRPAPAQDWTPSPEQTAVYKALSVRDPAPSCEAVEALATDPLAALLTVVDKASMPPWAPMRAAHCIVTRHTTAARTDLLSWVGQEQTRGLGLLVLAELDAMDEPVALELAQAALAGPLATDAQARLADSGIPSVRALVAEPAP